MSCLALVHRKAIVNVGIASILLVAQSCATASNVAQADQCSSGSHGKDSGNSAWGVFHYVSVDSFSSGFFYFSVIDTVATSEKIHAQKAGIPFSIQSASFSLREFCN